MFLNLMDCVFQSSSIGEYFIYVGILLIIAMLLLFVHSNWILAVVLAIVGILTLLDSILPNTISGGVFFFIFSIRIVNNRVYSSCIYFLTFMMVIAAHVKMAYSPADAINVLIAYSVIYLLDYLLYNKERG